MFTVSCADVQIMLEKVVNHLGTEQYLPVYYAVQDDSKSVDEILGLPLK